MQHINRVELSKSISIHGCRSIVIVIAVKMSFFVRILVIVLCLVALETSISEAVRVIEA